LGASLPWVAWQGGPEGVQEDVRRLGGAGLPRASLGELALSAKLTLVAPEGELGGFGVALRQRVTFPTASAGSFHAEGALTEETRLLVDYGLVGFRLHTALGLLVRHEGESGPCSLEVGAPFATGCTRGWGNEVPFLLGVSVKPKAFGWDQHGKTTLFLESRGFMALGPQSAFDGSGTSGLLLGGGGRWEFARDVSALLGAEIALVPALGAAPLRGIASLTWAPRTPDADHDQVPDDVDQCQELAEDRDGVQDSDGCPEFDEGE